MVFFQIFISELIHTQLPGTEFSGMADPERLLILGSLTGGIMELWDLFTIRNRLVCSNRKCFFGWSVCRVNDLVCVCVMEGSVEDAGPSAWSLPSSRCE